MPWTCSLMWAYAIALAAVGRGVRFKANAAMFSGTVLLVLGIGVLIEVARRFIAGEVPHGALMTIVAAAALAVNATVLWLLNRQRQNEVHIRASRIFTRADVVANAAVIVSGIAVMLTGSRYFDLVVGAGIGVYVAKEAVEILSDAQQARVKARQKSSP